LGKGRGGEKGKDLKGKTEDRAVKKAGSLQGRKHKPLERCLQEKRKGYLVQKGEGGSRDHEVMKQEVNSVKLGAKGGGESERREGGGQPE